MTEPTRGARARRGNRRPGSLLLTALLVLAIVASSALVFTNKVELLKLAVIVALWAAVVAAFVSFIYRRQSDLDQAKSRDLKLVYDLQLDREISARREYELSIETQLRRELASELRAQASDEVASLRAELAALRANLEIIFDTDLQSRPAIETERTTVHRFGDWDAVPQGAPERRDRSVSPGRVISSRIDTEATAARTDDRPQHRGKPDHRRARGAAAAGRRMGSAGTGRCAPPAVRAGTRRQPAGDRLRPRSPARRAGAARRSRTHPETRTRRRTPDGPAAVDARRRPAAAPPPPPPVASSTPGAGTRRQARAAGSDWRPAPAQGQFIPAGAPGSNWASSGHGER